MGKLAVVAIGGNSLIRDKDHQTVPDQFEVTWETCGHIAGMIEQGWDVVITHGNGPQVGFILTRSELASHVLHRVPLDSCGADTQGAIGYMIQQGLYNEFKRRGIKKQAVSVVTQVLVRGVEAVIDKDYASALLAIDIKADLFLMSTAVERVALNFGEPNQKLLDKMTLAEAKRYYDEGHFLPGSMGPKILAIISFLESGGKEALITNPENSERALLGETGTRIVP